MNRRDFGQWGIELSGEDFACALAASGIYQAAERLWPPPDEAHLERTLGLVGAFCEGTEVVPFRLPIALGRFGGSPYGIPVSQIAPVYQRVVARGTGPRLEVSSPDGGGRWLVSQLQDPAVRAQSVYLRQDEPAGSLCWAWPLRVGFLSDDVSTALRRRFEAERDHPELTDIVVVPAHGVECDLLLLPFDLKTALRAVLAAPPGLGADCVAVLGGLGAPDDAADARLLGLRTEARASAAVIADIHPAERVNWLCRLVAELSHSLPFDVALARVRRDPESPALLSASRRFIETATLPAAIESIVADLGRHGTERLIPVSERVVMRLNLPPTSVHRAKPPSPGLPRFTWASPSGDLGERVRRSLPDLRFIHEGDDATTMAEIARGQRAAPPPPPRASRRIQAQVHDVHQPNQPERLTRGFREGVAHRVDVRIGTGGAGWVQSKEVFPDDKLPPGGRVHEIVVVFVDPTHAPEPQTARLLLPAEGSTETASFHLFARPGAGPVRARITVLHQNRVLQTALLCGPVLAGSAAEGAGISLEPETVVSPDLADLGGRPPFDVALVCNHVDGEAQATACAGEEASLISLSGANGFVLGISDLLGGLAARTVELDPEALAQLLRKLAAQGVGLYRAILRGARPEMRSALAAARRWQIVTGKDGHILPLEIAYSFHLPEPGAPLCEEGFAELRRLAALRLGGAGAGDSKVTCPAHCEEGKGERVCPLGFLGLTSVIERQAYDPKLLRNEGADFAVRWSARPGQARALDVLRSAQLAASSRVNSVASGSTDLVAAALRECTREPVRTAADWKAWVEGVKSHPSLLVLLVHKEKEADLDVAALEIGEKQKIAGLAIDTDYVDPGGTTHPVVLLVGCNTSLSDDDFQSMPPLFQDGGAALVLGTIASILGRDAGPVTAELVRTMAAMSRKGDISFGEALLATRQKVVGQRTLMAMCLTAYGDTGWLITRPDKEIAHVHD